MATKYSFQVAITVQIPKLYFITRITAKSLASIAEITAAVIEPYFISECIGNKSIRVSITVKVTKSYSRSPCISKSLAAIAEITAAVIEPALYLDY